MLLAASSSARMFQSSGCVRAYVDGLVKNVVALDVSSIVTHYLSDNKEEAISFPANKLEALFM